jgi:ABC-type uncharacterized transport system permease subunit
MNEDDATDQSNKEARDNLLRDYNSILRESAVLTTFSGILFGFLLNISINFSAEGNIVERVILAVALFSITVAISLFIMPVIYHHVQYPYKSLEKFKIRSHRFLLFGIVPSMITLYLGLELALDRIIGEFSFFIAAVPLGLVYLFFRMRK